MSGSRRGNELIRELEAQGWEVVVTNGGHLRARHPDNPREVMFLARTPSDHRAVHNARAIARRIRRRG